MALKGKPIAIGTSDTTIYTCPSTIEASVHGLVFANNTGSAVTITLKVYIQSLGTTTTVATGISVSANSTYTWPKPIDVNAGDYIQASASTGSAIVCLYSTYEGSATPAEVGFTPEGTWSSGSTYQTNDVVSYNGSSYLAIQASTNQNPASATSYWMVLAAKGDAGSGISSITAGTGLSGGTITTSGTIAIDSTVATLTGSQTLTNKTLTNPSVNNYTEGVVSIGTVSSSHTLALTNGTVQTATLTASTACTFTMPTATAGKSFILLLKQAASTGNGSATFTGVKWGTAGAPTISATAGKMDILTFVADGTNWYGSIAQGYTP
jgi:hypothetical protein